MKMNGVSGLDSAPVRLHWARANWANEKNFVMIHAPGAGSFARPVDQLLYSKLPLYHGCPLVSHDTILNDKTIPHARKMQHTKTS